MTQFAAHTFKVPIALICLVDRDRQWFKSQPGFLVKKMPRDHSLLAVSTTTRPVYITEYFRIIGFGRHSP